MNLRLTRRPGAAPLRPTYDVAGKVDRFVTELSTKVSDDKDKVTVNLDQLVSIKDDVRQVIDAFEKRPEFKIMGEMSERKIELDDLIANAEDDYAKRKREHDTQIEAIDKRLTEITLHVQNVQKQTLATGLKNINENLYYHTKIVQQIVDVNASIDAQGCCASFFCCFPSKEIKQKQKQLKQLQDERDAFSSEDFTVVMNVLMKNIEQERKELLDKQDKLTANQPEVNTQKLRDERAKLITDIDAKREAYYYTVSPPVMLNLVRLQSFVKRMQKKLNTSKSDAQAGQNAIRVAFLEGVLKIVDAFQKKFDEVCANFVCRSPVNEANKISYAQYCDRYHRLKEDQKKSIIQGEAEQGLIESIFPEHTQREVQPGLASLSTPSMSI